MDHTTNYNLKKPGYNDFADIQDINDNMDTIDAAMVDFTGASSGAAGAKGFVPAPAAGDQNKYMRADGSWQAPVNNALATAAGGVLDARMGKTLKDQITTLNDALTPVYYAQSALDISNVATGITVNEYQITKVGKILFLDLNFSVSSDKAAGDLLFAITTPGGLVKTNGTPKSVFIRTGTNPSTCLLRATATADSSARIYAASNISAGNYYGGTMILVQA